MKKKASIEFETKGISCWVDDNIAVLKLSCSAFETIVNVEKDDSIMDWMDLVEASKNITGIMAVNDKDCFGDVAYANFLSEISGQKLSPDSPEPITKFENSQIRSIEINMLMNFIKKIMNFKKVFISALNGQVATPFFGLSLASDLRLANENVVFSLSHLKYAIHPSGALPFFLPRFIGISRATEMLLRGGTISVREAEELGLVNKILSKENFMEEAIAESKKLCRLSPQYIKITKTLLHNYNKELNNYFDIESNYLLS
ncbi:MAG: enoyl-CoA hydratase/isomerase family protein [Bacteroidetes bacterium]|nr:enoyl-CoA hydratase/isomerase family protein [Bacteroidota bacterium]